ncbi:MAG: oligosaccharide flippase family protein [Acidimicrobiales bacterium]|jgi:O-antigen/teichoic acid export membrane protein
MHQRGYAVAYLVALAASSLTALALAAHAVRPKLRAGGKGVTDMLRRSLPLGQFDLFAIIYARADSIMLFFISGDRAVALYGVAFQIAIFLFALPALLSNVLLPDFMSADADRRHFLARRALDVILTVAVPLPIYGTLFARPFVVWLAGRAFGAAGPLLAILTGAAAIALVNGYLFRMAVFAGAERGLWRAIGVATVSNLTANAIAVSLWGATGAAGVMILSETLGLVMYWRIYRSGMPSPLGRRYPLSVVAASAVVLAIWWGLHSGLGLEPGTGFAIVPRVLGLAAGYALWLRSLTLVVRRLTTHRWRGTTAET